MCASCQNGNVTPPAPCGAEHRPCVQVARTVTSPPPTPCVAEHRPCMCASCQNGNITPPHPMCCGTSTMCASCQNGNITPPAPCVAEHRPCVQVARTVTSPHPPQVLRNTDHVCKLPERSHHPPHPMCCGTPTMCASCQNGNITPPHPMCCGTSTMCASCKNGNITPPHTMCCGTPTMCASCQNTDHVCKLPER